MLDTLSGERHEYYTPQVVCPQLTILFYEFPQPLIPARRSDWDDNAPAFRQLFDQRCWQMVRRGNFALDLGYFLQGALTVDDRRQAERSLIAEYRTALELPAEDLPSADEVWLRYRASVAHGLAIWIATLSGGDAWQRPDICLAFAQRYAAAFIDLKTRDALDAIA